MDAFTSSVAFTKIRKGAAKKVPVKLAFLDIDGTWSGAPADQQTVRNVLEEKNFVVAAVTHRTPEMLISWTARNKSGIGIQKRSPALFRRGQGAQYQAMDPAHVVGMRGMIDPDIVIGTSGTELFMKQTDGSFVSDQIYEKRLPRDASSWRQKVQIFLDAAHKTGVKFSLHRPQNVAEPPWRVELRLPDHNQCEKIIQRAERKRIIQLIHDVVPEKGSSSHGIVILPLKVDKRIAIDHVLLEITRILEVPRGDMDILVAGDGYGDVAMGLWAGVGAHVTFLIPGDGKSKECSKLRDILIRKYQVTGRHNGDSLKQGVWWFAPTEREIIYGNDAFPGTKGPQTLISWLGRHVN